MAKITTKKSLQLLAERTGIANKQIRRDFDIVYFMLKDETKNREEKTIVLLHNYYVSLNIDLPNDLSDEGVEKRLNIGKSKCERMTEELKKV